MQELPSTEESVMCRPFRTPTSTELGILPIQWVSLVAIFIGFYYDHREYYLLGGF